LSFTPILLEILVFLSKLLPILAGIIGSILLMSPDRLPSAIRKRPYLLWPTVGTIYVFAVIALVAVGRDIFNYANHVMVSDTASSADPSTQPSTTPLEPLEIPETRDFDQAPSTATSSLNISGVGIGTPLAEVMNLVEAAHGNCTERTVEERIVRYRQYTNPWPDVVFQEPLFIECFKDDASFHQYYIYPDVYETGTRVFAVLRVSKVGRLTIEDMIDLLESRFGTPAEPYVQGHDVARLYFFPDGFGRGTSYVRANEGCFLYIWRAFNAFNRKAVAAGDDPHREIALNSYELDEQCGPVLVANIYGRDSRIGLLLTDTDRVQQYREYGTSIREAEEIRLRNEAREEVDF